MAKLKGQKTDFFKKYPFTKPQNPEQGVWKGVFCVLTMLIGTGINPNGDKDCLTRMDGGLFSWSPATLKKLNGSKISGADLEAKQVKFVCRMLQLMYDLMLETNANSPDVPFKPFVGRSMNLQR